ncbi:hypothetical protein OC846_004699 [Tilletia horrida]|uniref:SERRATE/Ars2 N-terminal domain-containing protein n=1 Tax=Tilletia horrida TaxID=155126 RepID=A0AAN6JWP5_9BASI|nr:hypothetical protein OC846_004699 [Tilletia horrida]KAK0567987.1 hypothetical protein OC861_002368 [Tilletia horrida]
MDRSRKRARSPGSDEDDFAAYRSRWDRAPAGGHQDWDRERDRDRSDRDRERDRRRSELDPDQNRYRQRAGSPGYEAWLDEQEAIVLQHERDLAAAAGEGSGSRSGGGNGERSGLPIASGAMRPGISERISSANGNIIDRYVPASYSGGTNGAASEGHGSGSGFGSAGASERRRFEDAAPMASDGRDTRNRERGISHNHSDSKLSSSPIKTRDPLEEDNMLSFKAFCAFVRSHDPNVNKDTTTAELYERHQAYKREFNRRAVERFWREHRYEAWFMERYSLEEEHVVARKARRKKGREGRKEKWLAELRSGVLDPLTFDAEDAIPTPQQRMLPSESSSSIRTTATLPTPTSASDGASSRWDAPPPDKDASSNAASTTSPTSSGLTPIIQELTFKRHGIMPSQERELVQIPPETTQILLVGLPTTLARNDVNAVFENEPGFQYVAYGEVNALKRWTRIAWVMFEAGTDVADVVHRLGKTQAGGVHLNMSVADRAGTGRRRLTPEYANSIERLVKDLDQAKKIIAGFEAEDRDLFNDLLVGSAAAGAGGKEDTPDKSQAANGAEAKKEEAVSGGMEVKKEQNADAESPGSGGTKAATKENGASADWLWISATYEIEKRCQTMGLAMNGADVSTEGEDEEAINKRREILKKHLDLHLDLLRVVYHCDYYLGAICDFPEELVRRIPRHVRKQPAPEQSIEQPREHTNDESWAKGVDSKAALLINPAAVDQEEYGGRSIEKIYLKAAEPYVQEEHEEKYRCSVPLGPGVCNKAFKAPLFVQKHVMNRHRPLLDELASSELSEANELNQLALDPSRVQLARIGDPGHHSNGSHHGGSNYNSPSSRNSTGEMRNNFRSDNDSSPLAHRLGPSGPPNGRSNGPPHGMNNHHGPFNFPSAPPTVMQAGLQQMAAFAAMQFGMPFNPAMLNAMANAGMQEMARNMGGGGGGGPFPGGQPQPQGQRDGSSGSMREGGGGTGTGLPLPPPPLPPALVPHSNGGMNSRNPTNSSPRINQPSNSNNNSNSNSSSSSLPSASRAGLPARPLMGRPRGSDADSSGVVGGGGSGGNNDSGPLASPSSARLPQAAPSGPDPRARRSQRSYEDLDGAAASGGGDVELQY